MVDCFGMRERALHRDAHCSNRTVSDFILNQIIAFASAKCRSLKRTKKGVSNNGTRSRGRAPSLTRVTLPSIMNIKELRYRFFVFHEWPAYLSPWRYCRS